MSHGLAGRDWAGDRDVLEVRIVWPDGTERTFGEVTADEHVVLHYDGRVETVDGSG